MQIHQDIIAALNAAWENKEVTRGEVHIEFEFTPELIPAVKALMEEAAELDAIVRDEEGIEIPEDENAPWGKWHRAANIAGSRLEQADGAEFYRGDWSWEALIKAVGAK